jgi:hypothetical protein
MKLFNEGGLRDVLEGESRKLKAEVESQDRNYLLNANETQLIEYFTNKYRIEPLEIHSDRLYASDREELIPADRFDNFRFHVQRGEKYRKQVVTYHVPFSGDQNLLRLAPSTRILWTQEVNVSNGEILFDLINWSDDAANIAREAESFLKSVQTQAGHVATEVSAFNARLETEVTQIINGRKAEVLKKSNLLASLGVPIKKAGDVPSTFAAVAAIRARLAPWARGANARVSTKWLSPRPHRGCRKSVLPPRSDGGAALRAVAGTRSAAGRYGQFDDPPIAPWRGARRELIGVGKAPSGPGCRRQGAR